MNATATNHTSVGDTMVSFLRGASEKFGPRTALMFKPAFRYQRWSYADLWEESGRVATMLQERGLAKGDRVLLWGPNCPQWVLSFFGSLRAGGVVVPLDLRCPAEFVRNVASQTEPKLAFVSRLTPEFRSELGVPEVYFEELEGLVHDLPAPTATLIEPDDLAEIMFTSGTTGDPKGVMLTHKNLTSNVDATSQHTPGKPSDRLLSILPLSHMFEQLGGLFLPLRVGANVTYPTARQPTVLARTMQERKVTMLLLVPQGLELLMNSIEREVSRRGKERLWRLLMKVAGRSPSRIRRLLFRSVHKKFGGNLRMIASGGAALDRDLGRKWELLGVNVTQGYGATEASPVIAIHMEDRPRYDSVGPPLPNVEVRISDDDEVLLRGPSITPGYWQAADKTAAAFDDGWYKTGDQGYLDESGFLHLKGRKKDMIVLPSGQNVFPEDIEAVLNKHEAVTEAAVVGLPTGPSVEVHAVLVLDDPADAEEAVGWANDRLAEHQKVRGHTVWPEDDLPRTHTMKVKKGVLVDALTGASPAAKPEQTVVGTGARGLEHIVADISGHPVEEITEDKVLSDDLEMDSLGRVELLSAIEEELGVYLEENQVDQHTKVRALATLVQQGSRQPLAASFPAWGMSWWCKPVRGALQRAFIFPLLAATYRLRVAGLENFKGVDGPALLASNHSLGLDNGLIIKAMPLEWRRRLAIAGAAYLWDSPLWSIVNPLVGNGFPFSQEGAVRASLDNLGRILDRGWSVLIYPEGKLTEGGPIQPFLGGAGLVAVEGGVPVVPMRLHVRRTGRPKTFPVLRRGDIEIRFGKPISFGPGTDYQAAAEQIESAVRAL